MAGLALAARVRIAITEPRPSRPTPFPWLSLQPWTSSSPPALWPQRRQCHGVPNHWTRLNTGKPVSAHPIRTPDGATGDRARRTTRGFSGRSGLATAPYYRSGRVRCPRPPSERRPSRSVLFEGTSQPADGAPIVNDAKWHCCRSSPLGSATAGSQFRGFLFQHAAPEQTHFGSGGQALSPPYHRQITAAWRREPTGSPGPMPREKNK